MLTETLTAPAEKQGTYSGYRYSLLPPERIRELSTLKPGRALADIMLCWALIVGAMGLVASHPCWWTVLVAVPVIGNRYYGLFIIGHDGMHRRLFPNVKRSDFWNDLLILAPIGVITRINNRNHLLHHRLLATPGDPDRHKHGCFNKSERAEVLGFLSGISSVWLTIRGAFVTRGRTTERNTVSDPRQHNYTARDILMLGGWFAILAGGLTHFIGWWAYPVLWLLPVYSFTFLGDNFRSFAEHSRPESDSKADQHRLVTYISNPIERMFVAPMNMNYHAAHHLWPSIPYYNLPIADQEMRQSPKSIGLEWRNSYFGYLLRYWMSLPIEACKQAR